jgi:kinesin family protein 5
MATPNTIKVVARFRPQNKVEAAAGSEPIVDFSSDDTCTVNSKEANGTFTFDRIFPTNTAQHEVFDYSIRSTVDDVLAGYNGTVFAYGQTGSGKTYTMMGADIASEETKGIIPRIVEQIFAKIMESPETTEFTVKVSYMEIYMEKIRDLLVPQHDNLPVHEDKQRGVYVKGLGEFYVGSVGEVYQVLERGGQARAVAATNMNQESSRSHSIFVIEVTQKNMESGAARSGRLFLVDLAGSEKVGKTGASGQTLEEAKKINKSLSALGMVINALSDGKSSHIPYRDSKLTRILQESLGGNSRTTLIINCSPMSYNDSETMSTLRFGERAKTIKQKAKINEELSPAQLKALLKKMQSQTTTYESYIQSLEGEVSSWRKGDPVPKDQWTPALSAGFKSISEQPARSQTPTSRVKSMDGVGTPRPESRGDIERAATPSLVLEKDEKEEFLKRENELQDQVAEKERALEAAEQQLQTLRGELKEAREAQLNAQRSNEKLQTDTESLKMQIEKIEFETKEASITMDSLKEANTELTQELDDVKRQLLDAKMSAKESSAQLDEKERLKRERMAQMMAGFDLGDGMMSQSELQVKELVQQVQGLLEIADGGESISADALYALKDRLLEVQGQVRQADINSSGHVESAQIAVLEQKLAQALKDQQELLEKNLSEDDVEEVKRSLFNSLSQQNGSAQSPEAQELLSRQQEENTRLRNEVEALRKQAVNGANGGTLNKQLADFDAIKKSLMRDLQNRCERVVELEISLDSTREQYNSILRSSNSKQQQKKLAFLERNLEQLTLVQRQLVEQNAQLKKEVAIAERKLVARGERIRGLEGLVQESQEKLMLANHKYVLAQHRASSLNDSNTDHAHRFESQLMAVKERLEAAKTGSTRGLPGGPAPSAYANNPFGRIAKPLRGGGGSAGSDQAGGPSFAGLQQVQASEGTSKRSSWFFNNQRS